MVAYSAGSQCRPHAWGPHGTARDRDIAGTPFILVMAGKVMSRAPRDTLHPRPESPDEALLPTRAHAHHSPRLAKGPGPPMVAGSQHRSRCRE